MPPDIVTMVRMVLFKTDHRFNLGKRHRQNVGKFPLRILPILAHRAFESIHCGSVPRQRFATGPCSAALPRQLLHQYPYPRQMQNAIPARSARDLRKTAPKTNRHNGVFVFKILCAAVEIDHSPAPLVGKGCSS